MALFSRMRCIGLVALLPFLAPTMAVGAPHGVAASIEDVDIAQALAAAPHITSVEERPTPFPGTRFFLLGITQPVDHFRPEGETFTQTLTLLYRSPTAPMVLATTGYSISRRPFEGEPTRLLQANQLTMEHRFFFTSIPATVDWTKLTIRQAAEDQHRVVQSIRPLFSGKWLSTGGSKGGMTAIYHRRFFPSDVDATLAYVAPISFNSPDRRYISFVDRRGGEATRKALDAWQQAMLDHRSEMVALLQADAATYGLTFDILGADKTFEFAVLEAPFTLWQYSDADLAAQVPPPTATPAELYGFLDQIYAGVVFSWTDATLNFFAPYYYQSKIQLGYPGVMEKRLRGLVYAGQDNPASYPPFDAPGSYDRGLSMLDIQAWVALEARRVMFIYGENDSWTAGAFFLPPWSKHFDLHRFTVPNGNHGARLSLLPQPEQDEAYALLSKWMGVPVSAASVAPRLRRDTGSQEDLMDTFIVRRPLR